MDESRGGRGRGREEEIGEGRGGLRAGFGGKRERGEARRLFLFVYLFIYFILMFLLL